MAFHEPPTDLRRPSIRYRVWGMEDVGVFFDWCSLYQAPRTEAETACFRRAFADMSLYFAHR